jgi:hypothetical protein
MEQQKESKTLKEAAKALKEAAKAEAKALKEATKAEAKALKEATKAEAKALKEAAKAEAKASKAFAKALKASEVKAYNEQAKALKAEEAKKKIINRGTGAGGANTNKTGKPFEENTDNLKRMLDREMLDREMLDRGFETQKTWITKTFEDKTVVIVNQHSLKQYVKHKYEIKDIYRCPDEAYIIEYSTGKKVIKILEKKMQNVEGSVETKLFAGPSLKREYELMFGPEFEIHYGFCVSEFLQKKITSGTKKYNNLQKILEENNIPILFGNNANYFETLDSWIYQ